MKSFASKFNKTSFGVNTENFKYVKLADIFASKSEGGKDTIHAVNGLYVHKTPLGDSAVIIDAANQRLVNLPTHLAETVREILADDDAVELIKNGKVGYTIYNYESHGKKCYSISFADL